ncbi:MAG: CaiB/BaiF CoA transferase family protein [Dehalococcoidia bacterium]
MATSERSALGHLKVIEIAQGWAGPTVGTVLADFGADVVKVESVQRLDWWRGQAAGADDGLTHERSGFYNGINRNKRGITLDLASEEGRSLLLKMVRDADIFVENFTSHVIEQLRLTHSVLAAENPRIISISMPAYGSTGPWRDYPALGTTVESMCGVQSLTGYEDGPPRIQGSSWDPVIGAYGCFGVFAALHRRRLTGLGQHIEVSHIEAGTHFVAGPLLSYALTGELPKRMGNASETVAPHGCYAAAGDDQWITIVAASEAQWAGLKRTLAADGELDAPRFATMVARLEHRRQLDESIASLTRGWDKITLFRALQAEGVPAAPVMTPPDLLADEHLAARAFFQPMEREHVGVHLYPSRFFSMSGTPSRFETPAPTLGQHNGEVLSEWLGLSTDTLAELEAKGVIGTRPRG